VRATAAGASIGLLWWVLGTTLTSAIVIGACFSVLAIVGRSLVNVALRRSHEHEARVKAEGTEHEWIPAAEIAKRLGVPEKWVWTMAARGEIPHVKIATGALGIFQTSRRFRRDEVEAWMRDSAK
jgi:excisionase family DNA binding protein